MRYKLVLFDFDGTLADSIPWALNSLDSLSDKYRLKKLSPSEQETARSLPLQKTLKHIGLPFWKLPFVIADVRKLMLADSHKIPLFPGVPELLSTLKSAGISTALASSNSEQLARRVLGTSSAHIDYYLCGLSLFGKSTKIKKLLSTTGTSPVDAILIGDEIRDAEAAQKSNISFAAVSWGANTPAALQSTNPQQIFPTLPALQSWLCE